MRFIPLDKKTIFSTAVGGVLAFIFITILNFVLSVLSRWSPQIFHNIRNLVFYAIVVEIPVFVLFLGIVFFVILFKVVNRALLKRSRKTLVYLEDFDEYPTGWIIGYWHESNKSKFNIDNSNLIFSGSPGEFINPRKQTGAYIDLSSNIYNKNKYLIRCRVKARRDTTARFQLWVHDIDQPTQSKKEPSGGLSPHNRYQWIVMKYQATPTNKLRIHLHCFAGGGKIYIDKVEVYKV